MEFYGQLLTAVATVLAVVVANKLSFRRSTTETMWHLKRQSYGAILSDLAAVDRICSHAAEAIAQNESWYFNSERYSSDNALIAPLMKAVRDRFSDDYLILSDSFIDVFDRFLCELEADDPNWIPPEEHDHFVSTLRKYRPQLSTLARTEVSSRNGGRAWLSGLRWPFLSQGSQKNRQDRPAVEG